MGWHYYGLMVHGGDGGWSWWPLAHFASGATSPAAVGVHLRPSAIPWWHRAFLTPSVSLSFLLCLLLVFFSISTVKRVSPLPLSAAGASWEGRGGTGLNRSHINSPRLTAPPWAPRGEQAIVPGSLHPPSRLLPASLACSLPAPCIPLPTSCLFPAFSPHPVQPHPMGMSLFPTLPGAAM